MENSGSKEAETKPCSTTTLLQSWTLWKPEGVTPEGVTPEEVTKEGVTAEGVTSEGVTPQGRIFEGVKLEGVETKSKDMLSHTFWYCGGSTTPRLQAVVRSCARKQESSGSVVAAH